MRVRRRSARRVALTATQKLLLSLVDFDATASDQQIRRELGGHIGPTFEGPAHVRECLLALGRDGKARRRAEVVELPRKPE